MELFASKSEEKRVKTLLDADASKEAVIKIWPLITGKGFAVATHVNGKGLKSQICADKQAIINFLQKEL